MVRDNFRQYVYVINVFYVFVPLAGAIKHVKHVKHVHVTLSERPWELYDVRVGELDHS